MSDYDLADAIDKIESLAKAASGNELQAVKLTTALPTGQTAVLLHSGAYSLVGEPTADHFGLSFVPPLRIKRSLTIQTEDSLIDYIGRFKTEGTILFADINADKIVAVLDYHTDAATTGHAAHIANLVLQRSEEWKLWSAIDNKFLAQLEFARFLEENSADIKAPDGADLIEACRDLQARRNVNFIAAVRTASNNENFEFTDNTDARTKDGVEVPTKFLLELPVYFGARTVDLRAFLRWKITDEQKLNLGINLNRAEQVRQAMFKEIVGSLAERAGVPVIYGPYGS